MNGSNGGFIALYRRLLEHPLWTQLPQAWLKAWIYILLRANHTPRAWYDGTKDIEIPAGGFVTSIEKLASSARITTRQARGSLEYFQRAGMVTRAASNRHSILIVTNWSAYQFPVDTDVTQNDRQNAKQATRAAAARRQTNVTQDGNKQQITIEQVNTCASPNGAARVSGLPSVNDPPVGNGEPGDLVPDEPPAAIPAAPQKLEDVQKAWFDLWWPEYWLKKDREGASKAFEKHVRTEQCFRDVMKATRAQKPEMLAKEKRHRPHGATWLNRKRWEDEIIVASEQPVNGVNGVETAADEGRYQDWNPDWKERGNA